MRDLRLDLILGLVVFTSVLSFIFTHLVLKLAHRFNVFDKVEERKVHSRNVPRIGGVAIFLSLFSGILLGEVLLREMFIRPNNWRTFAAYLFSILVIFGLGLLDDLKGLNAYQKFPVEFAVALLLYFFGFRIERLSLPWGGGLELGILAPLVTLLWIVGVMNAMNIIDGLDGLAAGIALFASLSVLIIFVVHGQVSYAAVVAGLIGAILGFLPYNLNPARIFMGDSGSLTIGLLLSTLTLKSSQKSNLYVSLSVAVIILFIPIFDTLLAICRRARRGEPLFGADDDHIHHRLLRRLKLHRHASLTLVGISALFSAIGTALNFVEGGVRFLVIILSFLVGILFFSFLGYFKDVQRENRGNSFPPP